MEHRRGQRKAVSLLVSVEARRLSELKGEIVDISAGGAFIKLKDGAPLPNTIVRLDFSIPDSAKPRFCRALVVRRDASGIGVMFDRRLDIAMLRPVSPVQAASTIQALSASKKPGKQPGVATSLPVRVPATVD